MRSHTGLPRPPGATAAPLAHHTSRTATAPPPVSPAPRHIPPTANSPARDAPTIAAPLTTTHAAAAVVRASSHAVWEQLYGVSGTSWSLERLMYRRATGSDPATPALEGNSTNSQQPRSPSSSFLPPAWVREFVGVHSASPAHTAPHSQLSACPSQVTAGVTEGVAEAQQTPSQPVTNTPSVSCAAAAAAAPSEEGRKRSEDCPATLTAPLSNATAVTTSHRAVEGVTVSLRGGGSTSALFPSSPVPPSQAAADPSPFTPAAPPVDSGVPAPSAGLSLDGASAVVLRPVTQLSRRSALFASPGTLSSPPEWVLPPSTSEASLQPTRGAHATPLGGHSGTLEKTKDAHRDNEEKEKEEERRSTRRSCSEVLLAHSEEDDAEDTEDVVRGDDDDTAPTRRAMVNDEEAAAVDVVGVPFAVPSARCLDEEAESDAFSPFAPSDAVTPSMRLFSSEAEHVTHAKESSTTRVALDGLTDNAANDGCDGGLVDSNEGPDGDDDDSGYVTLPASPATALAKEALSPRDAGTDCRRPPHPMPLTPSPGPVVNLEATMTAMTVGTSATTGASTTTAAATAHTVSSPSVATVLFAHHAVKGAAASHEKGDEEPENNDTEAAGEEEARALWTSMERSITLVTEQVPHSSPSLTDDAGLVYSPPRCQQHEHSHSQQVEEEQCSVSGDGGDATGGYGGSPMTPAQEPSSFFWKSLSSTPPPVAATDTSSLLNMATTANTQSAVSDVEQAEEEEEQTPFIESMMKDDEEEEVLPNTADDDDGVDRQGAEADTAAQTVAAMVDEEGGFTTAETAGAPAVLSTPLAAQVEGRSASVPGINVGTPSQTPHKQLEEKEGVVSCDAEALVLPSPESDSCRDSELSTTPRQVRYTAAAAAAAPSAPSTTRTTADPHNGEAAQLLSDAPAKHTRTSPTQPSRPSSLSSSAWGESSGTADATAASAAPAQPSPAPPRSSPGEHEAEPSSTPVPSPPRRSTPSDEEKNNENDNNNNNNAAAAAANMFDGRHSVSALDFTWAEEAEHALRQQQERLRARSHGMSISGGCGSLSPREGESRRALSASVSAGVTPAPGIPLGPQLYRPITAEELRTLRAVSSGRSNESLQQRRLCSEGAVRSAWSASPQPQDPQSRFCTMSVAEESKRKEDEDVEESCGVGSERAASSVSGGGGGGGRVVEVDGELCDNTQSPHLRSLAGEEETRCWQSLSPPSSSPSSSLLPTSASPLRELQAARHGGRKRDRSPPLTTDKNQPMVRRRGEVASTAAAPSHATPTTAKARADQLRSADSMTRRLQSISPIPHQDGFGGRDHGTVSRGADGRPIKQDTSYSSETSRRFPLAHRAELSPSATIAATKTATMTTLTAHTPAQSRGGGGGGGGGGAATRQRHRARLNATLTALKSDKSAGAPGSKNGNVASSGTNEFVLPRTVSPEPTPSPARAASPLLQQRAGNVPYAGRSAAGTALKGEKEKTKEKVTASNALLRQGKVCVMGQAGDAGSRGGVSKKERKRSGKAAARGKPSIVALNENLRHRRQAEKENTN